jgi:transcriptional regulator with XRE-family HTH domain
MPRSRIPERTRRNRQPPGARVRARRLLLGLTQEQAAAAARISQEALSQVELGKRPGSPDLRAKIAAALHCQVTELWPDGDGA